MTARRRAAFRLFCAGAALVLAFIWGNSLTAAPASSAVSGGVTAWVNALLAVLGAPGVTEDFVRKAAHFSEFAALGFCTGGARRTSRSAPRLWWELPFCALCAAADEFLQLFSPGRSAQAADALLDFSGALTGACALALAFALARNFSARLR